ncbi:MAG: alpha-mannosidase [Candidatus Sigynarchaeota archaeon]
MGKDEKNIIISHTHWDREWYLPFSLMRFRLVAMMDKLVNLLETDNEFTSFMLDGQTCMLEDYLEIRPEMRGRLGALIKAGRIQIGPYYVLSDAWLQTGEGYVRNLLVGHAISREWGVRPMKVGYIPDQYNHFEQMPQIFAGFGINAMAFGRSMGNQQEEHGLGFEFEWKAPDGSSVLALHLIGGYGMGSGLPEQPELAVDMLVFARAQIKQIKKATRWSLLFSGDDHRLPEHVLPAAIKAWNEIDEITEDEGTLQLGTMEEFVRRVLDEKPDLPAYEGELRGARYQRAFQGVYSSCMPLKRRNALAHDLLERYAEPLAAISTSITGMDYRGFLTVAWRELLKNQAHDSAWTASWNQVMKEMDTRFDVAIQNAEETRNWAFLDITSRIKVPKINDSQVEIVLFNPLEFTRIEPVTLIIPVNFDLESGFTLMDASGQALKSRFESVPTGNEEIFLVRKFVGSHGNRPKRFYKLHVETVEVPALGYTTLVLIPSIQKKATEREIEMERSLKADSRHVENDVISVDVNPNGTIDLFDKRNGNMYRGLNAFEDISDIGDGYEFQPIEGDVPISSTKGNARSELVENTGFSATIKVSIEMDIPAEAEHRARRSSHSLLLPIVFYVKVNAGDDPRVEISVHVENKARDHKISCTFPTGIVSSHVDVDGPFGITTRPVKLPPGDRWIVKPTAQAMQHRFVSVSDVPGKKGLLIANKGLPEYEATEQVHGTVRIGLTLLRSTRGWGLHINKTSPVTVQLTEVPGPVDLEYCIIPHDGSLFPSAFRDAMRFRYPVHAEYRGAHNKYQGYFPNIPAPSPFLLMTSSFIELDPPELVLSCLKQAEGSDGIILRLYNASKTSAVRGRLKLGIKFTMVELVDLEENVIARVDVEKDDIASSILLDVPKSKILTFKLSQKLVQPSGT